MKKVLVLFVALLFVAAFGYTQSATANIHGKVLSEDGGPLPGVTVTLTGDKIGTRTAVTTEEGNFRFLKLPVGNYSVKFELGGFDTVVKKGLNLHVGDDPEVRVTLKVAKLSEEIVVNAKSTLVNTRRATIGSNITKDMIAELPTSRNPWTVLSLVPGMMIDREDVGGNESGQQSSYYGLGASNNDSTWNVDGANITDPSAIGAAPAYLNVNQYEEMQVTVGANDITAQTGGVQLNFVTKRAGNNYSGDFHLYAEDEAWQISRDVSKYPEYYKKKGFVDPGIKRLYQYGVNFGGPIIKDKIWWFGSWGIQDIHSRTIVGDEDATWLAGGYGKLNFQLGNTYGDFDIHYDNKLKWGRTVLSRAQQAPGTLFDQTGPSYVYKGDLQQVMGNFMLEAKVAYTDGGFVLDPRGSDIDDAGHNSGADWLFYYSPRFYAGSMYHYITNRNTISLALSGNYFLEGILGGDHEIKFGFDRYTGTTTSQTLYPNQRVAFIYLKNNPSVYQGLWLTPDGFYNADFQRISAYVQDTFTMGKLVVNFGVRYDRESGKLNASDLKPFTWYEPGSAHNGEKMFEKYLVGALHVKGGDSPLVWSTISPRISLAYDITGDGKTVVKLAAARYGSQAGNSLTSSLWPSREVDVYWHDDGDLVPEYNEIGSVYEWHSRNVDTSTGWIKHDVDPNYNTPLLDELTLSVQKAITDDLAVSVNGYYKKTHNLTRVIGMFKDGSLETKDNWYKQGDFKFQDGSTVPYYANKKKAQYGKYFTNYKKAYNRYMAVQFVVNKRLSHKWMANASFTYQDWKQFRFEDETFDLTNFDYFNQGVVAPGSGGSGLSGIYVNARWMAKFMGLYQLPHNWTISAFLTAREGYVIPYHESVKRYLAGVPSWTNIYPVGKKFGDDRLPTFWVLNFSLQKTFKVSDRITTTVHVDGYNITNNNTTLKVDSQIGDTKGQIQRVLNPTVFQFGVQIKF
jgi:hypothetical protein